jgi:hypothetical protein
MRPSLLNSSSYCLVVEAELLTVNRERQIHHQARAKIVKRARRLAHAIAIEERIPPLGRVDAEFWFGQHLSKLADPGAHYPSAKAVLDGIVDAGILEDDDGRFVRSVTMQGPYRAPHDETLCILRPVGQCPTLEESP